MQSNNKIDTALSAALEISEENLRQNSQLGYGFQEQDKKWKIIVKYYGDIKEIERIFPDTNVVELLNQFAIITTGREYIDAIASLPQIQYVEKPKRIYFNLRQGRSISCVNGVQKNPSQDGENDSQSISLSGRGVLIGIVDSGERVKKMFLE